MATAKKAKAEPQTASGKVQGLIDKINGLYSSGNHTSYKWYNPQIRFVEGGFQIKWYNGTNSAVIKTVEEILPILERAFTEAERSMPITVAKVTNYGDALTVNSRGLEVGCRSITFAKFEEIVNAVAKFRERQAEEKKATTVKEKTTAKKAPAKKATRR